MVLEQTEQLKDRGDIEFESESLNTRSVSEQAILQDHSSNLINTQHASGSHLRQLSAQAIFTVLDHITRWLRQAEIDNGDSKIRSSRLVCVELSKIGLRKILCPFPTIVEVLNHL